ncbi:MAG: hypothetical protein JW862_06010 [Anaerolineales bacterium]|nr:hypothetical protein [Anaerolineales bacterium]
MKSVGRMAKQKRTSSTLNWFSACLIPALCKGCVSLIVLGSALNGITGGKALALPPVLSVSPVVVVTSDGLLVDWRVPEANIMLLPDGTIDVQLPDTLQTTQPGAPQLPFISVLVAVPPGALPTLHVVLVEETDRSVSGPLALAPFPEGVQRDASGLPIGGSFSVAGDLSASAAVQLAQGSVADPVRLEPAGVVRGVTLARLVFYPARLVGDSPQAHLRLTTYVRVALTFSGEVAGQPWAASTDPLLTVLRSVVINPEQVRPVMPTIPILSPNEVGSAWIIEVASPGLTAITYAALTEMGFPVASTDPHTLHLARAGTEIAAEWDGDEDASFEPGESLLFYAEPRFSRWTSTDVYFLWQGDTPGLRIPDRPAAPLGLPAGIAWVEETAEVNQLYTPDCFCGFISPGRDGDHWTWDDLKRPGHSTASYLINLPSVDATQPATLTVWLIGYTNLAAAPDHRVDVDLNGMSVGSLVWDGKQPITAALPILPGTLHGDANTLTLTLPGIPGVSIEGAWLDAFSIRAARGSAAFGHSVTFSGQLAPHAYTLAFNSTTGLRVYDITDPSLPLHLTGVVTTENTITFGDPFGDEWDGQSHRYMLTTESELLSPVALRPVQPLQTGGDFIGADYVLIAPADFMPALDSLISLRQAQGLTVAVEDVQAIYAAYGDGRPDPAAIRAYLAYAYAAWTLRPVYVVLVGDGSFDPRQYRTDSPPTFIPPYLANVDPWAGETAADNRYVTVDGQDALPDMLIGRLPVKTLAETQIVVDKIVQYETNPIPGGWNQNVTFVADDADEAGNFAAASETLAMAYVASPFIAQRIYFTPPATTITTTRQAVLNSWNAGALLVHYAGHSSWQQWALERFLHLDDLPVLRNDRRWPIVIEMTCFTGAFHRPEPTLDEELLNLDNAGVVAAWGATGLGVSTGHNSLGEGFFQVVFSDPLSTTPITVGQAAWAGKLSLAVTGRHLDLLDTFTLLGDPALRLNRNILPWASQTYLPFVIQNTPER